MLLINLGTPDAPDARAVRRYLAEFLSDPRVIEIPRDRVEADPARDHPAHAAARSRPMPITRSGPTKARRSRAITQRQAEALRERLPATCSVDYAMRYGNPGIAAAIDAMKAEGCTRILAAPLYPQYCAATTATANDAVFAALARDALAAGAAHAAALLRRSALYRCAEGQI